MIFSKKLIARIFPRHSRMLQAMNQNPLFIRWTRQNEACPEFPARPEGVLEFYRYVHEQAAKRGEPIDYLEFGVAEGRTLRIWSGINSHWDSRFYGFDSFRGLPEDWLWARGGLPKGSYSTQGAQPAIADPRVQCLKGLFQESLPAFLEGYQPRSPLVVHMDCDLYSSTLFCLTRLDSILEDQVVLFDEFDNLLHEFAAFQDYAHSYRRTFRVLARLGYFKKAAIRIGPLLAAPQ